MLVFRSSLADGVSSSATSAERLSAVRAQSSGACFRIPVFGRSLGTHPLGVRCLLFVVLSGFCSLFSVFVLCASRPAPAPLGFTPLLLEGPGHSATSAGVQALCVLTEQCSLHPSSFPDRASSRADHLKQFALHLIGEQPLHLAGSG